MRWRCKTRTALLLLIALMHGIVVDFPFGSGGFRCLIPADGLIDEQSLTQHSINTEGTGRREKELQANLLAVGSGRYKIDRDLNCDWCVCLTQVGSSEGGLPGATKTKGLCKKYSKLDSSAIHFFVHIIPLMPIKREGEFWMSQFFHVFSFYFVWLALFLKWLKES